MFTAKNLKTFTKSSGVWRYHAYFFAFVVVGCDFTIGVFGVVAFVVVFNFKHVESPIGITASL